MLDSIGHEPRTGGSVYEELERLRERCAQLQRALESRIIIEQAKGAVSVRCSVSPKTAFEMIRGLARSQQRDIHGFCAEIVANGGRLDGLGDKKGSRAFR